MERDKVRERKKLKIERERDTTKSMGKNKRVTHKVNESVT
jgi:hypothetical protein